MIEAIRRARTMECLSLSLSSRAYSNEKQSKQNQLALQLQDLKNVVQSRKIEERLTPLDKAYEENLAVGDNKYSTIQKARSGTASKRMAMLQDL